jgi:hypothetical protein
MQDRTDTNKMQQTPGLSVIIDLRRPLYLGSTLCCAEVLSSRLGEWAELSGNRTRKTCLNPRNLPYTLQFIPYLCLPRMTVELRSIT